MTDESRKAIDQLERIAQFMADRAVLTETVTRLVEVVYADPSIPAATKQRVFDAGAYLQYELEAGAPKAIRAIEDVRIHLSARFC